MTTTSSATSESPSEEPSSPTPTADETTGTGEDPTEGETPKPPVLRKDASGRELKAADFFSAPDGWLDGRFSVAGKQDLAGVAGPLTSCVTRPDDDMPAIELRLANNFNKISMKVGQSDDSESSESLVTVNLVGNGKYIDQVVVPFNRIKNFTAAVPNVNALQIQVWKGGKKCQSSDRVDAVLMELRVE